MDKRAGREIRLTEGVVGRRGWARYPVDGGHGQRVGPRFPVEGAGRDILLREGVSGRCGVDGGSAGAGAGVCDIRLTEGVVGRHGTAGQ